MGRPSSIQKLPHEVREYLNTLLRTHATQVEATDKVNEQLAELGLEPVSKSAINRYAQRMQEVGKKITDSRAVADMWIGKLGSLPGGKMGHLLTELVRSLAFDLTLSASEQEDVIDSKTLSNLALTIKRLDEASEISEKRERAIREEERERAIKEMEESANQKGLGKQLVNEIKEAMRRVG